MIYSINKSTEQELYDSIDSKKIIKIICDKYNIDHNNSILISNRVLDIILNVDKFKMLCENVEMDSQELLTLFAYSFPNIFTRKVKNYINKNLDVFKC